MKQYGLIGYPLSHSFSKKFFSEKFRRENIIGVAYENFPISSINQLPALINTYTDLAGLNVTIPYKESVIQYLDEIDMEAKIIGAVNTINVSKKRNKKWMKGYNSDAYGFKNSLMPFLGSAHKKALIFGTGGASKAVAYALDKLNIEYIFVSRNPSENNQISYDSINDNMISELLIIINTTPLGMYPDTRSFPPISYKSLTSDHILYDLVYNPEQTTFLKMGKENGAITINGLRMLELQAEKSWEIWNTKN
jgi:shikimate dehydrogenase